MDIRNKLQKYRCGLHNANTNINKYHSFCKLQRILLVLFVISIFHVQTSLAVKCESRFRDLASRTLLSTTVFQGRALSIHDHVTRDDGVRGVHNVTFSVLRVFKGDMAPAAHSNGFANVLVGPFGSPFHLEKCVSPAVKVGLDYIVFSDSVFNRLLRSAPNNDLDYYEVNSQTEEFDKKKTREIQQYACIDEEDCTEPPKVELPKKQIKVKVGQRVTLNCKKSGKPLPELTWIKDNKPVKPTKNVKTKDAKKKSRLQIRKAELSDSGSYQCQGESVLGTDKSNVIRVIVSNDADKQEAKMEFADLCAEQGYCMHGGTCAVITSLGTRFCVCTNDFYGERCLERIVPVQSGPVLLPGESAEDKYLVLSYVGAAFGAIAIISVCIFLACFGRQLCERRSRYAQVQRPREYGQVQNSGGSGSVAVSNQFSFGFSEAPGRRSTKEKSHRSQSRREEVRIPVLLPPNGDIVHIDSDHSTGEIPFPSQRVRPPPASTSTPKPSRSRNYDPTLPPLSSSSCPSRSASLGSRIPPDFRLYNSAIPPEKNYYSTQESSNSEIIKILSEGNIGRVQSRQGAPSSGGRNFSSMSLPSDGAHSVRHDNRQLLHINGPETDV